MTSPIFGSQIKFVARLLLVLAGPIGFGLETNARAEVTPSANHAPLPELPAVPSLEVARPAPDELEQLDARTTALCSNDDAARERARRELLEVTPKLVPALRFRLAALADTTDHDELKQALLAARKKARGEAKDEPEANDERSRPDNLQLVGEHPDHRSRAWCSLVSVLAQSRMLARVGTVEAVRGLIDVYVRFGEFLRINTQRELEGLGERAVPALIETRRHPAEKIAKWSARELDTLGRAIPSETVQTADLQVLADVLRAYGRVRDPDAARIVVSFANSERSQIREASRQAIALFGEVAAWQLRDTYEDVVGKKPPRDWNWERTARELFGEFDSLRSAEVTKLYEAGMSARERGDLTAMRGAFDRVLNRSPDFPKRAELAAGYLDFARKNLDSNALEARTALGRVERLGAGRPVATTARSLRLTLEAEALAKAGIFDRTLLQRAVEADPSNERARRELEPSDQAGGGHEAATRFWAAAAIGVVALLGIAFVLLRRGTPASPASNSNENGSEESKGAAP